MVLYTFYFWPQENEQSEINAKKLSEVWTAPKHINVNLLGFKIDGLADPEFG